MRQHSREVLVGVVAIFASFLLYFGINFLKGMNVFLAANYYIGIYSNINGLKEQAPVYVRGYKVGQVKHIQYNFKKEDAFTVQIVLNEDITVENGTVMCLIADGLLGGTAVELRIPTSQELAENNIDTLPYKSYDTLPTLVIPGVIDNLQSGLLLSMTNAVDETTKLITNLNKQIDHDNILHILEHTDTVTANLNSIGNDLRYFFDYKLDGLVADIDTSLHNFKTVTAKLDDVQYQEMFQKVDSALTHLNYLLASAHDTSGTVGMLLSDDNLYYNINRSIVSIDSLLTDLKTNPKRYVHFSLFGRKKDK